MELILGVLILLLIFIIYLLARECKLFCAVIVAGAAALLCLSSSKGVITGGRRNYHSHEKPVGFLKQKEMYKLVEFDGDLLTKEEIAVITPQYDKFIPLSELNTLSTTLPNTLPYRRRSKVNKFMATHMGQRKLLLTEIDFLTDFAKPGDLIVYAGAASGVHIPFLASLFKSLNLSYHLYDPRDFDMSGDTSMIKTFQQLFLEEDAAKYAGRDDVLFISDIRTGGGEGPDETPGEDDVKFDMKLQKLWVEIMKPRASMLKFRLEYTFTEPTYNYLCGEIRIQAWPPISSSETRLIVTDVKDCKYNNLDYDNQLYYHNAIEREWLSYDHGIPHEMVKGIDSCYDCALEVHIWKKYLERFPGDLTIADLMNTTSKKVRRGLLEPPHGLLPDVLIKDKRKKLATYRTE